jgi:hypothetical protein
MHGITDMTKRVKSKFSASGLRLFMVVWCIHTPSALYNLYLAIEHKRFVCVRSNWTAFMACSQLMAVNSIRSVKNVKNTGKTEQVVIKGNHFIVISKPRVQCKSRVCYKARVHFKCIYQYRSTSAQQQGISAHLSIAYSSAIIPLRCRGKEGSAPIEI